MGLQDRRSFLHRCARSGDVVHAGLVVTLLIGVWYAQALEVNTGKVHFIEVMNGSSVLLPCTYASCIGIKNLYFNWQFKDNGTLIKLCEATIPAEGVEPNVKIYHERVEFVGSSKQSNISILLHNVTFEDQGDYICFARNPKEKERNHSAVFTLFVVDECKCDSFHYVWCLPTQIISICYCLRSESGGQHIDRHHCVRAWRGHRSDHSHHGGESCSPRHSKQGPGEE
uniref:Sodium channel subunit beta-4-like n=1 Tax=Sinocyclocheilus rhinocerous TaxID=307959 RepID=A0A673MIC4_9TELE